MSVVVIGAGVGGLATAIRLAHAGHRVTVLEQGPAPGGKAAQVHRDGFTWDSGPSLLTMPWVLKDLFAETGAPLTDELELARVEPVTDYRFADGSRLSMSADLPTALTALERWSPGAGEDWARLLGTSASIWSASVPYLTGPPPWPPRRPTADAPAPALGDLLRIRPWWTVRDLARHHARDPRLAMVIERFASYAGADPRRAPAALVVAGYVEHAFGAWHPRGGIHGVVRALVRRLEALGGELRTGVTVQQITTARGRVTGVRSADGHVAGDVVVANVDEAALGGLLGRRRLSASLAAAVGRPGRRPERSLSGFALMLGLQGRTPGLAHHTILFPDSTEGEWDDVFVHRRPVRDPTLYVSTSSVTDPSESPRGDNLFVLVNAPAAPHHDWDAYGDHVLERLAARGMDVRDRVIARAHRSPADLESETGAVDGAIYGRAPHGRLGTLKRPPNRVAGVRGLWRVGGTTHPGGGLPLVLLSGALVAREIGPA